LTAPSGVSLSVSERDGLRVLTYAGRLDAIGAGRVWKATMRAARQARPLVFDLALVARCDTAGATLLVAAEEAQGAPARVEGATPETEAVLTRVRETPRRHASEPELLRQTARQAIVEGLRALGNVVAYIGEAVVALARLPMRRRMWRSADFWRTADQAGVRAVPLVLLLGVLIGLILAFQSLVPLRRFGADLYAADLVGISLARELGPLLAAVILSGRTGSAFAAEIGTMKVNEELDALATMGLDSMTMLVLPRLLAAMFVMPALTIIMELAGLAGMTLVLKGFGFPPVTVWNQIAYWVVARDVIGGLVKSMVFGAVIAMIGCWSGLTTGIGPRAVGVSATRAVVGGIVASIVIDGLFALGFYQMAL